MPNKLTFAPTARPEIERYREACRLMAEFVARNSRLLTTEEVDAVLHMTCNVQNQAVAVLMARAITRENAIAPRPEAE